MTDIEGFLTEYEALCNKYKLIVGTYGVFNSVGLGIVENESTIRKYIEYLRRELSPLGTRK